MNTMYEGQYIINSFYAVNANNDQVVSADEKGFINLSAGDTIKFKSIYNDEYVPVNTIVFFADEDPVKVQLNDNSKYPFYIDSRTKRGVKNMRVYSFTAQIACKLYYEGIVC